METFVKVLEMAQECKMLKVGTVAVDGTKIAANASKHSAVSHKRAGEMIAVLQGEVQQLMEKAEQADSTPLKEGLTIPKEIQLREDRIKKFDAAIQVIEARAKARGQAEQVRLDAEYEAKRARRQARREQGKAVQGREPQPKQASMAPKPKDQYNFTDAQSAMMPVAGGGFVQGYNAQVTVEVDSMLIVGQGVTTQPNDRAQLVPGIESIPASLGQPATVLVDSGYYSPAQIQQVEGGCEGQGDNAPSGDSAPSGDDAGSENNQQMASNETADCAGGQVAGADDAPPTGITVLVAVNKITHGCRVADLEVKPDPEPPAKDAPLLDKMRHRINTAEGRAKYNLRKQTVEPVIGIIKSCIGFRQFSMRGQGLAESEWALVSVAWNLKRLHVLTQQAQVRLAAAQMQS